MDPCNKTVFNSSDAMVSRITTTSVDGTLLEGYVSHGATALTVAAAAFRDMQAVSITLQLATSLRNFNGSVSRAWFTDPTAPNCLAPAVTLIDTHTFNLVLGYDANAALFRLPSEDYTCAAIFSSDVFQCQMLTLQKFNFTVRVQVLAVAQLPWYVTVASQASNLLVTTVLGGQSLLQQSRTASLMKLASCDYSLVNTYDVFSHPTQVGFGSSPQYYRRGMVTFNFLVIFGMPAMIFVVAVLASYFAAKSEPIERANKTARWFCTLKGPLVFFLLMSLLIDAVVESAVSLVAYPWDTALDEALGVTALLIADVILAVMAASLRQISKSTVAVPVASAAESKSVALLRSIVLPRCRVQLDASAETSPTCIVAFSLLQPLFAEYRVAWFAVVEYAITYLVSVVVGIPRNNSDRCEKLSIALLALYITFLGLLLLIRPHAAPLAMFVSISSEALCLANCILLYTSMSRQSQAISDAMRYVGLASYGIMWLQLAPAFLVIYTQIVLVLLPPLRRCFKKLVTAVARLLANGSTSSEDASSRVGPSLEGDAEMSSEVTDVKFDRLLMFQEHSGVAAHDWLLAFNLDEVPAFGEAYHSRIDQGNDHTARSSNPLASLSKEDIESFVPNKRGGNDDHLEVFVAPLGLEPTVGSPVTGGLPVATVNEVDVDDFIGKLLLDESTTSFHHDHGI